MAEGDIVMTTVVDNVPTFPCGGCTCADLLGHDLEVVISGVSNCGDCWIYDGFGAGVAFRLSGFTGVNGSFVATWNGSGWNPLVLGVGTIQRWGNFPATACDEDDPVGDTVFDITASLDCSNGQLSLFAKGSTLAGGSPEFPTMQYDYVNGGGFPGVSGANGFVSGGCVTSHVSGGTSEIQGGSGGFVTITPI